MQVFIALISTTIFPGHQNWFSSKPVRPKLGVNYPPGVICGFLGVTRNQNRNVVLCYERSLEKTFWTGNAKSF